MHFLCVPRRGKTNAGYSGVIPGIPCSFACLIQLAEHCDSFLEVGDGRIHNRGIGHIDARHLQAVQGADSAAAGKECEILIDVRLALVLDSAGDGGRCGNAGGILVYVEGTVEVGDAHPLHGDLLVADHALAEILLDDVVVGVAKALLGEGGTSLGHGVDVTLELGKHGLAVEGALVGFHELVENGQLLFPAGGLAELLVAEEQLVDSRGNLSHKDGVAGILGSVVLAGVVGVHGVPCLVGKGGHVVDLLVIVEQNIGLGIIAACAVRTAPFALGGVYVNPLLILDTVLQGARVLVAQDLHRINDGLHRLVEAVLLGAVGDEGGVEVIHMQSRQTQHLTLEVEIVVDGLHVAVDGINEVVVDDGGDLVVVGGGLDAGLEAADLGQGGSLLDGVAQQSGEGVAKLLVGLIELLKRCAADASVLAGQAEHIGGIGELHQLALLVADLAEGEVGVGEDALHLGVAAQADADVGQQLLLVVGQGVLAVAAAELNGAAVLVQRRKLCVPCLKGLILDLHQHGGEEEGGRICVICQVCNSVAERKILVVRLVQIGGQEGKLIELGDHAVQLGAGLQGIIEPLGGLCHGVAVAGKIGDKFLRAGIIGLEIGLGGVDAGQIPLILCGDLVSYVCHINTFSFVSDIGVMVLLYPTRRCLSMQSGEIGAKSRLRGGFARQMYPAKKQQRSEPLVHSAVIDDYRFL